MGIKIDNLAIVFGREDRGLASDEIDICDLISNIPLQNTYPSINLAQSAMIYTYVFREPVNIDKSWHAPDASGQKVLKEKAEELLETLEISKKPMLKRRIMERLMQINQDDTHLFLSFSRYLNQKINKLQ